MFYFVFIIFNYLNKHNNVNFMNNPNGYLNNLKSEM